MSFGPSLLQAFLNDVQLKTSNTMRCLRDLAHLQLLNLNIYAHLPGQLLPPARLTNLQICSISSQHVHATSVSAQDLGALFSLTQLTQLVLRDVFVITTSAAAAAAGTVGLPPSLWLLSGIIMALQSLVLSVSIEVDDAVWAFLRHLTWLTSFHFESLSPVTMARPGISQH